MKSNNACDGYDIPDRDYLNFINGLEKVGKVDILEPNLAKNSSTEISLSLLEDAHNCNKKGKSHIGCNHLRGNILDFRIRSHRGLSTATAEEVVISDSDMGDSVQEKDPNYMYDNHYLPDPGLLLFVNHLREDGNSYFLELKDDHNATSMIFKYEEEEEEEDKEGKEEEGTIVNEISKLEKQKNSQNLLNKMSVQKEKNSSTNHSIAAAEPVSDASLVLDSQLNSECLDVDPSYQKYLDHLRLVDGDLVFNLESAASKSAHEIPLLPKNEDIERSMVDLAYQEFLNCLRLQEGFMILDLKSGGSIRYDDQSGAFSGFTESQKESTSSIDLHILHDIGNLESGSQLKVYDNDTSKQLGYSNTDSFGYKERLIDVISRPYDQNEYEELLGEATVKKPLCRMKNLRNTCKTYATNIKGSSYLDCYPQLAKQLEEANCQKGLWLLRGFFFWLQNLCHDGAFQPWMPLQAWNSPIGDNEDGLSCDDVPLIE